MQEHFSVASAYTYLNVTPKKLKKYTKIIFKCRKNCQTTCNKFTFFFSVNWHWIYSIPMWNAACTHLPRTHLPRSTKFYVCRANQWNGFYTMATLDWNKLIPATIYFSYIIFLFIKDILYPFLQVSNPARLAKM